MPELFAKFPNEEIDEKKFIRTVGKIVLSVQSVVQITFKNERRKNRSLIAFTSVAVTFQKIQAPSCLSQE